MSKIPGHIIDEIMSASRIEEVIGEFVQLKRSGSNLKGLSPFTNEKTPSFMVSPAKQIFKCFSTGKGGSVVTFLMEKEHYSYPEALRWLANKYNIAIPVDREPTAEELAAANEKDALFIINEFAKNHFVSSMNQTDEGKSIGLSYFRQRGFTQEIIDKFQLGYCLNTGSDLTDAALEKGYKFEYLDKVGLSKERDGRKFDFFKGRVIFPIHSASGRVLGFGGRTLLNDKKIAKYFNSPESSIYNKSEILYGLFYAKGEIIKLDECLLCEGYTDVISMHQAGMCNAVSSSGTSLTKEQIRLISRYTKNITILYDGDTAGIKASFRGIDLILEEGLNVKVLLFPDGEDPDSFSRKNSREDLSQFIATNRQDFIAFKAGILLEQVQNDPLQKAKLIKEIIHSISLIPDPITRSIYAKEIAMKYELEESLITTEVTRLRSGKWADSIDEPWLKDAPILQPEPAEKQVFTPAESSSATIEKDLIRIMLKYGDQEISTDDRTDNLSVTEFIIEDLSKDELTFTHEVCRQMYEQILQGLRENIIYTSKYFLRVEDAHIVQITSELVGFEEELSSAWESKYKIYTKHESNDLSNTIMQTLYNFKQAKIAEYIHVLQQQLADETLPPEEFLVILSQQMVYEKIKQQLSTRNGRIILK
jgi:DNA primase